MTLAELRAQLDALNLPDDTIVILVRLVHVKRAPRNSRLHRLRRYRWDLKTCTPNPIDARPVMVTGGAHQLGYTFTRWGALRGIARAINGEQQ